MDSLEAAGTLPEEKDLIWKQRDTVNLIAKQTFRARALKEGG